MIRSISWVVLSRLIAAAIQGLIFLVIARNIGADGFGLFAATVATGAVVGVVAGLGTSSLALRLKSIPNAKNIAASISLIRFPAGAITAIVAVSFGLWMSNGSSLSIILSAVSYTIAEYVCESTESILFGMMQTKKAQLSLVSRRLFVGASLSFALLSGAAVESALAISCLVAIFLSPLWLFGLVGSPAGIRETFAVSKQFWYSASIGKLETLDVVIASAVTTAANIGMYGAASRLTSPLNIVASSALSIYTPKMAAAEDTESRNTVFSQARSTMSKLAGGLALLAVPIAFAVQWILGQDFSGVWKPAFLVVLACAVSAQAQPYIGLFYSTGRAKLVTGIRLFVIPISLFMMSFFGWKFGAVGIAFGLFVMQCGQFLGLRYQLYKINKNSFLSEGKLFRNRTLAIQDLVKAKFSTTSTRLNLEGPLTLLTFVLLALVFTYFSSHNTTFLLYLLIFTFPILIYFACKSRFNILFISPIFIVSAIVYLIAVFGYLLRDILVEADGAGASVRIVLSEENSFATLVSMLAFVCVLMISAALVSARRNRLPQFDLTAGAPRSFRPSGWYSLMLILPALIVVAENGGELLQRNIYLFSTKGSIMGSLSGPLLIGTVLAGGYIFSKLRGLPKAVTLLAVAISAGTLLSFGSRQFALVPVLFAIGIFIAKGTKRSGLGVLIGSVLSFMLLPLPLLFRSNATHGIIPYIEVWASNSILEADWLGALNNVLVAFAITGQTSLVGNVSWPDLWVSINPLPGGLAGWYEIAGRMRLNVYTPHAAIGQLMSVGPIALLSFAVGIGAVLAWLEHVVEERYRAGARMYSAVVIGVVALFALNLIQYPLRSACRMLVYLVVLEILRRIWVVLRTKTT